MSGFHKGYEGSVRIQGKERKEIKDASFYQKAAYITHQPMILKGSVRENLLIGKANTNEEEMWDALKRVRSVSYTHLIPDTSPQLDFNETDYQDYLKEKWNRGL